MRILLTNDDGIFAPGLAALYRKLTGLGKVTVVAPTEGWSGASHCITFREPLACAKVELHDGPIDLVVSGINCGANVGINVYYSGTVAAAMEAAFLRIPSVAISVAAEEQMDYDEAARCGVAVLRQLLPLGSGDVVNINVPLLSRGRPKGIRVVPQATSGFHEYYIPHRNGESELVFLLAGGQHREEKAPADTTALADGFITVTALRPDMTDHEKTAALRARLDGELS
jgi:5'-nucleotidase